MSDFLHDFYHKTLRNFFKWFAYALRSKKSPLKDLNGRHFKVGDRVIHHPHDTTSPGWREVPHICDYDREYTVIWDDWGRVRLDDLGPIYLNWLLEIKK